MAGTFPSAARSCRRRRPANSRPKRTHSATLIPANTRGVWNVRAIPAQANTWAGFPVRSAPATSNRPAVGGTTPDRALKNVVLPAPLGPMIPTRASSERSRSTWSTAVRPPKRTTMPRASRTVVTTSTPWRRGVPTRSAPETSEAVGQVEDRHDQHEAEKHQIDVRELEAEKLGQQAEHDGGEMGPPRLMAPPTMAMSTVWSPMNGLKTAAGSM